jgi:hypothetical protein
MSALTLSLHTHEAYQCTGITRRRHQCLAMTKRLIDCMEPRCAKHAEQACHHPKAAR